MPSNHGQDVIGECLIPNPAPQVVDPVDRAIWQMVGMGFPVAQARKALAMTDTGSNLNVSGAIELCLRWGEEMRTPVAAPEVRITNSNGNQINAAAATLEYPFDDGHGNYARLVAAG